PRAFRGRGAGPRPGRGGVPGLGATVAHAPRARIGKLPPAHRDADVCQGRHQGLHGDRGHMTLSEHLAGQEISVPGGGGPSVTTLLECFGGVAGRIAKELARAAFRDRLGYAGGTNVSGDQVKKMDVWGHETVRAALRATGVCASLISEESP